MCQSGWGTANTASGSSPGVGLANRLFRRSLKNSDSTTKPQRRIMVTVIPFSGSTPSARGSSTSPPGPCSPGGCPALVAACSKPGGQLPGCALTFCCVPCTLCSGPCCWAGFRGYISLALQGNGLSEVDAGDIGPETPACEALFPRSAALLSPLLPSKLKTGLSP